MTERTMVRQTLQNRLDFDDDKSDSDSISITSTQGEPYNPDQEFLVDHILAEKIQDSRPYYLILWTGYPLEMSTWEPRENIQDESILDVWRERKTQEALGLQPSFSLVDFDTRLRKSEEEKANRHKRRNVKRRRMGWRVPESELDYDSESTEVREANKVPSMKGLTSGRKKPVTREQGHASSEGETHKQARPKQKSNRSENEDAPLSDDSLIQDIQKKASSCESSKVSKVSKRPRRVSDSSSDIHLARKRDLQRQPLSSNNARHTHDSSSSDEFIPLAHQGPIPQRKFSSGAGKDQPSHISKPNTSSRGLTSGRHAGRGKGATRGGLSNNFTNVFALSSKPPRKVRPNISENAADPMKAQKHFKSHHILRKAELAGRSRADAAPDLDVIGGLFNPSKPPPYQSLKPATLRKKSATVLAQDDSVVEETLTTDTQPDIAQIWGEQPKTQAQQPLPWQRQFSGSLRCYFFVHTGTCTKRGECKFLHSNDDRILVAQDPSILMKNLSSTTSNYSPSAPSQDMRSNNSNEQTPASTLNGKIPCRFWLQGDCKVGEYCKHSHENPPKANFIPRRSHVTPKPTRHATATSQPPKSVSFTFDEPIQVFDDPSSTSSTRPENSEKHSLTDQADAMSAGYLCRDPFSEGKGATAEHNPTLALKKQPACKYWQMGNCWKSTDCPFSHETLPAKIYQSAFQNAPSQPSSVDKAADRNTTRATQLQLFNITPENPTPSFAVMSPPSHSQATNDSTSSSNHLTAAPPNPNRQKMSIKDYHHQKAMQSIAAIAKEVTFGTDGLTSLVANFGDAEKNLQQSWALSFRSLAQLRFGYVCIAQDFETRYADLKSQLCWQGSITTDHRNAAYLKIINRVADHLNNTSTGLISVHTDLSILTYPARSEKWKFVEGPANFRADVRLRYLIFQNALGIQDTPQKLSNTSVRATKENSYKKILVTRQYDLHFRTLLPLVKSQDPCNFYLLFPSTASSSANFLASWLKSCRDCKIYHSETEGSWDHFSTLIKIGKIGVVLIHESAIASVSELPSILYISQKYVNFWHVADSASKYPLFPSLFFHADDPKPGQIITTRLFPHGAAILLTPSFIIADPHRTRSFLMWFYDRVQRSAVGTYKLLSCHDLSGYLLELASGKADESGKFYAENHDKPAKDALAMKKGLGYHDCAVRFEIRQLVAKLLPHTTLLDYPYPNNFDVLDETTSPVIYADSAIDPDDEHALVNWFAGWSMTRLDRFKKFVIIGTSPEHSIKATRLKYVLSSRTTPTSTVHATRAPSSKENFNSTIDDHDSPQKLEALEVAKKLNEILVNNSLKGNEAPIAQPNLSPLQINSSEKDQKSESPLFVTPNDNTWSPQFNESDSRSRSSDSVTSKTSNAGIKTGEDGRRFVPRSLRPSGTTRSEIEIGPGYTSPEDKEGYKVRPTVYGIPSYENSSNISSRRGSVKSISTESPLVNSPYSIKSPAVVNLPEEMDVDGLTAEVMAAANTTDAEIGNGNEGLEGKEIKMEVTTEWYQRQKDAGKGWHHIYVGNWEKCNSFLNEK